MATVMKTAESHSNPFPGDVFVRVPDVVVFSEHATTLRDGTPVVYDREALEQIAANCNRRIEETGNYAAICIGHTEKGDDEKPLIGFAGPFRVEERNGRAVIVADFHIFKDERETLRRFPRPSPEVWIPKDGFDPKRIFLDPIAMLGAETPRLDLGMTFLYRARHGSHICEKYAAVFASPSNVQFGGGISATKKRFKERYASEEHDMASLGPDDIKAILKAIEATDWHQWIKQQMASQAKPDEGKPDKEPPPDQKGEPQKYAATDDDDDDDDLAGAEPPNDKPDIDDDDDNGAPPAKANGDRPKRVEEYRCTTHYARKDDVMEAQKEIYQLRRELEHERALRVNAERRRVLESLARRYAVDVKDEMTMCAYGKMTDDAFEKHVARIEKYYRPLPVDTSLPVWGEPDDAAPDVSRELYRRKQDEDLSRRATEYAKRLANRGEFISYEDALDLAKRGKI